jgi:hypothetical protein
LEKIPRPCNVRFAAKFKLTIRTLYDPKTKKTIDPDHPRWVFLHKYAERGENGSSGFSFQKVWSRWARDMNATLAMLEAFHNRAEKHGELLLSWARLEVMWASGKVEKTVRRKRRKRK